MRHLLWTPAMCCVSAIIAAASPQPPTTSLFDKPATEAEMREAVESIEQLARELQNDLRNYRAHLEAALQRHGFGRYHPLFRTQLNGFQQDQIDLDDLDQFKMGRLAYELVSAGTLLMPDPFLDWLGVQKLLGRFEKEIDRGRQVLARTNIVVAHGAKNIPSDTFERLRNRWRSAADHAITAYEHGMAVRAIEFSGGEMVPTAPNVRRIAGGGRYAVICAFAACTSQPADEHNRSDREQLVH